MDTPPEPAAGAINPKYYVGANPHTYQGNLWHLHPSIVSGWCRCRTGSIGNGN
jgi:hypothetical protein